MLEKRTCQKCGGPTEGFVCDRCGQEMAECDLSHSCGIEHCKAKCLNCGKSEDKCDCR